MNRYKLIKPLPKFEVGDGFHINKKGNLVHDKTGALAYTMGERKKFPNILKDWFEKIPDEPMAEYLGQYIPVDKGQAHDNTIIVNYHGEPDCIMNCPMRHIKTMAKLGLSFKDENDCYKWLKKQEAYQTLVRDTKGFKPKWPRSFADAHAQNFAVVYDYHSGLLLPHMATTAHHAGDIYFATEDDARASIKAHPNEWKTYLGVEE